MSLSSLPQLDPQVIGRVIAGATKSNPRAALGGAVAAAVAGVTMMQCATPTLVPPPQAAAAIEDGGTHMPPKNLGAAMDGAATDGAATEAAPALNTGGGEVDNLLAGTGSDGTLPPQEDADRCWPEGEVWQARRARLQPGCAALADMCRKCCGASRRGLAALKRKGEAATAAYGASAGPRRTPRREMEALAQYD